MDLKRFCLVQILPQALSSIVLRLVDVNRLVILLSEGIIAIIGSASDANVIESFGENC